MYLFAPRPLFFCFVSISMIASEDTRKREGIFYYANELYRLEAVKREAFYDKALLETIQEKNGFSLFYLVNQGIEFKLKKPLERMVEKLFKDGGEKNIASILGGLAAMVPDSLVETALYATSSDNEKMVKLKIVLHACCGSSEYAQQLLVKNRTEIPFFINVAGHLIKEKPQWRRDKPQWHKPIRKFLINCFTNESGKTLRLPIATELAKKYAEKESTWHAFSPWLRIISTHYMLSEERISDKELRKLTKDLCAIDPVKLSGASRAYGEKIAQYFCAWMHRKKSEINEKTRLCEDLLKKGWQAPLWHDVNEERGGIFYLGEDTWGIAERNEKILSAELCYEIGDSYADIAQQYKDDASKEWRLDAYKWFLRSAQKGSIKSFERALQYGVVGDPELKKALNALAQRYPADQKVAVLSDLFKLYDLAARPFDQWKEDDKEYLDSCLISSDKRVSEVIEPALFAQALYARAYASALSAPLYGDTIINKSVLQDLKKAFSLLDIALHKDIDLYDPFNVMPQSFIGALHTALKDKTELQLTREECALVTSILSEQANYRRYHDYAALVQALSDITGYECCKEDARVWCENLFKTDCQRMIFLASYDAESLVPYLASATMFDTMSLEPEECEDANARSVQETMTLCFRKSQLADNLRCIAQKADTDAGRRALQVLLHYELYENLDEAKKYATALLNLYKKAENAAGAAKAGDRLKYFIAQGIAQSATQFRSAIIEQYATFFDRLRTDTFSDKDHEELRSVAQKHHSDPIVYALQAEEYAREYEKKGDKQNLDKVVIFLEHARRFGLDAPNSRWLNYITPLTKELLWKEMRARYSKETPEMVYDFDVIAYTAFLNKEKSCAEKKQFLQQGLYKHPFCSLLYVQAMLEESRGLPNGLSIDQAVIAHKALRYAMLQGQKSLHAAADLDKVTQDQAMAILIGGWANDSLGASITLASVQDTIAAAAEYIKDCPFKVTDNKIVFEHGAEDYLVMAKEMKILGSLNRAAEKGNFEAQRAVFRLCFSHVSHLMAESEKRDAEKTDFMVTILAYSLAYIKGADNIQRPILKKSVSNMLEALMKTEISRTTSNNLTRLKTALLVV